MTTYEILKRDYEELRVERDRYRAALERIARVKFLETEIEKSTALWMVVEIAKSTVEPA